MLSLLGSALASHHGLGTYIVLFPGQNFSYIRAIAALVAVALIIAAAYLGMIQGVTDIKKHLGNFVAFNAVVAIALGAGFIVSATDEWMTTLLVAGACLGGGFIFGLLFGFPTSNAGASADSSGANGGKKDAAGPTLFQQSADALSKVIAGATLVKAQTIYSYFLAVAGEVSNFGLSKDDQTKNYTFGASVSMYFLLLGFLSGLLLPHFYDLIVAPPGLSGGDDNGDVQPNGDEDKNKGNAPPAGNPNPPPAPPQQQQLPVPPPSDPAGKADPGKDALPVDDPVKQPAQNPPEQAAANQEPPNPQPVQQQQ